MTYCFHDHQDNDSLLGTKQKPKNTLLWALNWLLQLGFEYDGARTKHPTPPPNSNRNEAVNKSTPLLVLCREWDQSQVFDMYH